MDISNLLRMLQQQNVQREDYPSNEFINVMEGDKNWEHLKVTQKTIEKVFGKIIKTKIFNYNEGVFTIRVITDSKYILEFEKSTESGDEMYNYKPFSNEWKQHGKLDKINVISYPRIL